MRARPPEALAGPVRSECPASDFLHTAAAFEMFKGAVNARIGATLVFGQETWVSGRRR